MLSVLDARSLRLSSHENHRALETVLRTDYPVDRCIGFVFLPKKSLYATPTIWTSRGQLIANDLRLMQPALKELYRPQFV